MKRATRTNPDPGASELQLAGLEVAAELLREPVMSLSQAADYLGISRTKLYQMVWHGEVAFSRVGKKLLKFRQRDLDALIRS